MVSDYIFPLKEAIWSFKFEGQRTLATPLGRLLAQVWKRYAVADVTAFIPVPMSPQRQRERGYNQAELLARVCAQQLHLPTWSHSLYRSRQAPPQHLLDAMQRHKNVDHLFACHPATLPRCTGATFVIVDDIVTTGATLNAVASPLLQAGAAAVWGLTLAGAHHIR